jgi:DNA-directed RNA polymerase specialized sigma24 family protein
LGRAGKVGAARYRRAGVVAAGPRRLAMPRLEIGDETLERIERIVDGQRGADALSHLDALPADQRAAIHAHIIDERGYAEIGAEMQCSPSVVRQRVSRGLNTLRRQVSES